MSAPGSDTVSIRVMIDDAGTAAATQGVAGNITKIGVAATDTATKTTAAMDRVNVSMNGAVTQTQKYGAESAIAQDKAAAALKRYQQAVVDAQGGNAKAAESVQRFGADAILAASKAQTAMERYAAAAKQAGQDTTAGLQQGISGASAAAGQAGTSSGNAFAQGFQQATGKIAAYLGVAALVAAGMNQQDAQSALTAQLHLAGDEVQRFGDLSKQILGDNFAESLTDANSIIKSVVLNIDGLRDAAPSAIKAVAEQVSGVAQQLGADVDQLTAAVGQQIRTGLATDAQGALDIIAAGFQAGVDKKQDYLDTLNEYSVQFQKLGISGATATGLLSQGLKAGARDADVVGDALKEFSVKAVDGTSTSALAYAQLGLNAKEMAERVATGGKTAADATQLVLDRLRAVKDPAYQSQIAVGLFGSKAEDLGKALYALDLTTAADQLGDVSGRSLEVAKSTDTASGAVRSFWNESQNLAGTLGSNVLPLLQPILSFGVGVAHVFGALPKPIQAVSLALIGIIVLQGPLTAMLGIIQARAAAVAVSLAASTGIAGAVGVASGYLSRFAAFISGPWGIAILLGVVALTSWISSSKEATLATRDFSGAIDENTGKLGANATSVISDQVKDSIKQYQELGGVVGDYTLAVSGQVDAQKRVTDTLTSNATKQLENSQAYKDAQKYIAAAGYDAKSAAAAILAGGDALADFQAALQSKELGPDGSTPIRIATFDVADLSDALSGSKTVYDQYGADVKKITDQLAVAAARAKDKNAADKVGITQAASLTTAAGRYLTVGQQQSTAAAEQAASQRDASLALNEAAVRYEEGRQAGESYSTTVVNLGRNLDDLQTEVRNATEALDRMAGRKPTVEQALSDESAAIDDLANKFGVGTDKAVVLGSGILYMSGQINTATQAGRDLRSGVLNTRDAIVAAAQAASDAAIKNGDLAGAQAAATAAATDGYNSFISLQTQILGSRDAAEKLAVAYGLVPKDITTAVDLNTDAAKQKLYDLQHSPDVLAAMTQIDLNNLTAARRGMAGGGTVVGGSGTHDDVPLLAMGGEFVVQRARAQEWGPELNYINSNQKYAGGGSVTANGPTRDVSPIFPGSSGGRSVTIAPGGIQISITGSTADPTEVATVLTAGFRNAVEQVFLEDLDRAF